MSKMFFYEKVTITDKEGNVVTLSGKLTPSEKLPMVSWTSTYKTKNGESTLDQRQVHVVGYIMSQAALLNMKEVKDGTVTAETTGKTVVEVTNGKFKVIDEKEIVDEKATIDVIA